MDTKKLITKLQKLILTKDPENILLARNIVNKYSKFEIAYIEKKINYILIEGNHVLTTKGLHHMAGSEKELELVKELYQNAINLITDLHSDEYELNLKLRNHANSIKPKVKKEKR